MLFPYIFYFFSSSSFRKHLRFHSSAAYIGFKFSKWHQSIVSVSTVTGKMEPIRMIIFFYERHVGPGQSYLY